jgi:phosphoribosylanthranilate isomerase
MMDLHSQQTPGGRIRVKVCCISSMDEARLAIAHGADALGLVGEMPSGPGVIDDELAREIATAVRPVVDTFLLTSFSSGREIAEHVSYCGTSTVQVVRHIDAAEYRHLIKEVPTVKRVQVLHVEDESILEVAAVYEPFVHAFLLDSGRPAAHIAELGGTGRAHDWRISAELVRRTSRPVFLAGGLNAVNVRKAVAAVQPFGVDLCSGVRRDNRLNAQQLGRFMARVRQVATEKQAR